MATTNSAVYDEQKSGRTNTSRNAAPTNVSNDVQFATIKIASPHASGAANDIMNLCILPAGCIPVPALSSVYADADPGTALTLDIGTAANPDGWGDAVALTTAGKVEFCAAAHTAPAWNDATPLVADSGSGNAVVYATITVATSLTAANLFFTLAYKRGK